MAAGRVSWKRELTQAVKSAGSVKAAAQAVGVSAATFRRWQKSGMPKRGDSRAKLLAFKERRKRARKQASEELKKLKELLKEARKLAADVIAPVRTYSKKMDGPRAVGYQWVKAWQRELSLDLVDEVIAWTKNHHRRWSTWNMRFRFAQFSYDENFAEPGSNRTIEVMVQDPDRNSFMAEQMVPTPRFSNMAKLLDFVRETLESMIESGSTIFMLTSELYNYRFKTAAEKRAIETEYRQRSQRDRQRRERRRNRNAR